MNLNLMLVPLALFVIANPLCNGQSTSVDPDLLQRFDSEAPEAWQRAKEDYLRFAKSESRQCDVTVESSQSKNTSDPGKNLEHQSLYVNMGKDYGILKGGLEHGNVNETVALYNKSYFALLQREKGDSDWLLKNIGEIPEYDSDVPLSKALGEINRTLSYAANPLSGSIHPYDENPFIRENAGQESVRSWADLRDRKVLSIDYVDYDGSEMVKVVMTFKVKVIDWSSSVNNQYGLMDQPWKYTAVFDPENHWCLREVVGGVLVNGKVVNECKRTYTYTEDNGVQICDSFTETAASASNSTEKVYVERTNAITRVSLSPSDFTLSAYGLPEPSWYRPPTPWWLYSSVAGLALVIVGAVLLRFGKKMV